MNLEYVILMLHAYYKGLKFRWFPGNPRREIRIMLFDCCIFLTIWCQKELLTQEWLSENGEKQINLLKRAVYW